MTARIGLAISGGEVRAVLARRGRVEWFDAVHLGAAVDAPLLAELLRRAPVSRIGRAHVVAGVGGSMVMVKRLHGLPATRDREMLSAIVRASPERYFVRSSAPAVLAGVLLDDEGVVGAAFDGQVVNAIRQACREAHLVLDGICPVVMLAPLLYEDGRVTWHDHTTVTTAEVRAGRVRSIQRCSSASPGQGLPEAAASAHPLTRGVPATHADAWAAAQWNRGHGLSVVDAHRGNRLHHVACVSIGALAVVAGLAAAAAPHAATYRAGAEAAARAATLRVRAPQIAAIARDLNRSTTILERIGRFAARRRSSLVLLGSIAQMLPESTAVISLRVDTLGGSMSLLSRDAAAALAALAEVDAIEGIQLAGPLTREMAGYVELERFSVRFRFARSAADSVRKKPR